MEMVRDRFVHFDFPSNLTRAIGRGKRARNISRTISELVSPHYRKKRCRSSGFANESRKKGGEGRSSSFDRSNIRGKSSKF